MQHFKAFYKVAWKRIPASIIYLAVFAVLVFLMGSTSQTNMDANFQSTSLSICVIDEDHTVASEALVEYMDSLHELVAIENDPELLQDYLYYRYISYVLTIPEGFEEKLLAGETEDLLFHVEIPGSTTGNFVNQQVSQYTKTLQIYTAGGYEIGEAVKETENTIQSMESVTSISFTEDFGAEKKEVYYFYQYLPYISILLLLCGMAPIIQTFRKKDLSERIQCASMTLGKRNAQLSLGCITYSLLVWCIYMVLGGIVYGNGMFQGNALYAMLNSFAFLLVSVALTLLISNYTTTESATHMLGNIIGMGSCFLAGVFVPQSMLSEGVLNVARFLPTYWYIRANDMLAGFSKEALDMQFYWRAIGIQLLFAGALFAAALVVIKLKRQESIAK